MNNSNELKNSSRIKRLKLRMKEDKSFIFWSFFCLTIILMGIVYFIAINQVEKIKTDENGKIVVTEEFVKHFEKSLPQNLQHIERNIVVKAKKNIDDIINEEIDKVFEPVYKQIPRYSDFHYSLPGEYTEITAALSGRISESVKKHLFDSIDFDNKLNDGVNNIKQKSNKVFLKSINTTHNEIKKELNLKSKEFSLFSKSFIKISIDDMQKRFRNYSVDSIRAGGVAAAVIAKKIGSKVAAKLSIKISAKLGLKTTGGVGAAATGATIGTLFGGPVGSAIGGVVCGVAGWVITDKIIIEVDQYINEEDFKYELRQSVSQQKQKMKDKLKKLYGNFLNNTADNMKNDIRNMKLKDHINRSN